MRRKLQVFVSSTFEDLKKERQSAVQSILTSGHIPAGMELFSAGDETQKEIIKKWIDESDVYLLILGGRYGSIDPSSGKSYTHWEYQYAGEVEKPRFAVVISEQALEDKVRNEGTNMMEKDNPQLYREFRKEVMGRICKIFSDERDIELAIFQKMSEYLLRDDLMGWVRGSELPDVLEVAKGTVALTTENSKLKQEISELQKQLTPKQKIKTYDGLTFLQLRDTLEKIEILYPKEFSTEGSQGGKNYNILILFYSYKDNYATGITNQIGMRDIDRYLYFNLAPQLMTFNLIEKVKVAGAKYEKIQTSKLGFDFLKEIELYKINKEKTESEAEAASGKEETDSSDIIKVSKATAPQKRRRKPSKASSID